LFASSAREARNVFSDASGESETRRGKKKRGKKGGGTVPRPWLYSNLS